MAYTVTKQDSQESYGYKEIYCSKRSDVENVPTNFLPGSVLIVREGPEVFFLDEDENGVRSWKRPED